MPTRHHYLTQPLEQRLRRMERTHDEVTAAIRGYPDAELGRRPDAKSWAAKEVICHLRDIEELFVLRFHMMLGTDEPTFLVLGELPPDPQRWGIEAPLGMPLDPNRWAQERQYLRNDTNEAVAALGRRRKETLILLGRLTAAQRQRRSVHVTLGPMTFEDWVALVAAHDDNHLGQLQRALLGSA